MKEYTIRMSFSVKAEDSDYEEISNFADELAGMIMEEDNLIYQGDIEITDVIVDNVEDHNESFDADNFDEEDEY